MGSPGVRPTPAAPTPAAYLGRPELFGHFVSHAQHTQHDALKLFAAILVQPLHASTVM